MLDGSLVNSYPLSKIPSQSGNRFPSWRDQSVDYPRRFAEVLRRTFCTLGSCAGNLEMLVALGSVAWRC